MIVNPTSFDVESDFVMPYGIKITTQIPTIDLFTDLTIIIENLDINKSKSFIIPRSNVEPAYYLFMYNIGITSSYFLYWLDGSLSGTYRVTLRYNSIVEISDNVELYPPNVRLTTTTNNEIIIRNIVTYPSYISRNYDLQWIINVYSNTNLYKTINVDISSLLNGYVDITDYIEDTGTYSVKIIGRRNMSEIITFNVSNSVYYLKNGIQIKFYNNTSEANRLDKNSFLTELNTVIGVFRTPTSIINPIITIESDFSNIGNYCYIPIFNRYYYITNIVSIRQGLWEVSLNVDVLMSNKDIILEQSAIITRNEFSTNKYIVDQLLPVENINSYIHNMVEGGQTYDSIFDGENSLGYYFVCKFVGYAESVGSSITKTIFLNYNGFKRLCNTITSPDILQAIGNLFGGDPTQGVLSLYVLPFSINSFGTNYTRTNITSLTVPYMLTTIKFEEFEAFELTSGILELTDVINVNINDWTDLPPYTERRLYIPWAGFVNLPNNIYEKGNDNRFRIKGILDLETFTITTYIYKTPYIDEPVYIIDNTFGREISITRTGANERLGKYIKTGISIAGGLVDVFKGDEGLGSTLKNIYSSAVSGVQSGDRSIAGVAISGSARAISEIAHATAPYLFQAMTSTTLPTSSQPTTNLYQFLFNKMILFEVKNSFIKPDNYEKLYGLPDMTYDLLSNKHGFTIIEHIHLEGFVCTNDELDIISQILYDGIILP